jgi:hypothetical protein
MGYASTGGQWAGSRSAGEVADFRPDSKLRACGRNGSLLAEAPLPTPSCGTAVAAPRPHGRESLEENEAVEATMSIWSVGLGFNSTSGDLCWIWGGCRFCWRLFFLPAECYSSLFLLKILNEFDSPISLWSSTKIMERTGIFVKLFKFGIEICDSLWTYVTLVIIL